MADERTPLFRSTVRVGPTRKSEPLPKNRYEDAGDLGQGGMGKVARGVDRFLGRPVAFKRAVDADPQMLEALLHEAEIAARLDHPSIVTIHDVAYDENDEPFVVMRLVDGRRLGEVIEGQPLAARLQILPRVVTAIEAIAYAHSQGVVHRDLKPDNILLADRGDTVVIDWGLALDLRSGADPYAGSSVGTPGFIPPDAEPPDPRVDVYALGVTLYMTLAGKLPGQIEVQPGWTGSSLGVAEPGVPDDLVTIVDKACARDRLARYPSATELAADLQRFIGGQLVASHRYSVGQRLVRWVRKHRIAVGVGLVAFAALVTFGVIALRDVFASRAQAERERTIARKAEQRAAERADQLLVDRARIAVSTDPPRAIALLDLREHNTFDAATWAVAVEAYARGIPRMRHVHEAFISDLLPLDEERVITAGMDGTLAFTDARGTRTLKTYPHPVTSLARTPDGFLATTYDSIDRFDRDGKLLESWPEDNVVVRTHGPWIAATSRTGLGWFRRLDAKTSFGLPVSVRAASFDPTEHWLAFGSDQGIFVAELATGKIRQLSNGGGNRVSWSPDGTHLLGATLTTTLEWSADDWSITGEWPEGAILVGYFGKDPTITTLRGCVKILNLQTIPDCTRSFGAIGVEDRGRFLLVAESSIEMFAEQEVFMLAGAPSAISRIAIDPTSRFVYAGTRRGELVAWDLRARQTVLEPEHITAGNVHDGHVYVTFADAVSEIDRDGHHVVVGHYPDASADDRLVMRGDGVIVAADVRPPGHAYALENGVFAEVASNLRAATVSGHELLALRGDGVALMVDLNTKRGATLTHEGGVGVAIAASPDGAAAVAWTDGRVWWTTPKRQEHRADMQCAPTSVLPYEDSVDVLCGGAMYTVGPDGVPHERFKMDVPITDWRRRGNRFIVATNGGAIWRIDGSSRVLLVDDAGKFSLTPDRFVASNPRNEIFIYDIATGSHARIGKVELTQTLTLSEDGRTAVAVSRNILLMWRDPTPANSADWPAWRASLTTATLSDPNGDLQWH